MRNITNDASDLKNEKWNQRINQVEFLVVHNIRESLQETDVVITITPATEALIQKDWVKEGTHFSCIGADLPGKQELDETIVKVAKVFTDDIEQASKNGEIQTAIQTGLLHKELVTEIGLVMNGSKAGRNSDHDITVFDSTGIALQDLAVTDYVLRAFEEKNIGTMVHI